MKASKAELSRQARAEGRSSFPAHCNKCGKTTEHTAQVKPKCKPCQYARSSKWQRENAQQVQVRRQERRSEDAERYKARVRAQVANRRRVQQQRALEPRRKPPAWRQVPWLHDAHKDLKSQVYAAEWAIDAFTGYVGNEHKVKKAEKTLEELRKIDPFAPAEQRWDVYRTVVVAHAEMRCGEFQQLPEVPNNPSEAKWRAIKEVAKELDPLSDEQLEAMLEEAESLAGGLLSRNDYRRGRPKLGGSHALEQSLMLKNLQIDTERTPDVIVRHPRVNK
ncbi:hypothetical protein SAMN04487965_0871 [Microbulbifer donghaiensis]|uniref:Uncharacterized protein n=1 Tax=Microbulbifer donghaiensis TaxID=494016 RepID=A0A1M4X5L6_9GAMM|nr:hypothetical protein [Microbulbifer donghaiensis]SHE88804.1 hypothetical protein SAMN04487965_0871 [Microbulbifer donghaiensis]